VARHTFGGSISDWAFSFNSDGSVAQAAGATLTFWDSLTGGTQYTAAPMPGGTDDGTGLLDGTNTPISSVTCDSNGEIPDALQGPDGVYKMAADASGGGTGPRRWIEANDVGDDILQLLQDAAGIPALEALQQYVYYDATNAAYPPRPDTTSPVVWVGPVRPPVGGAGADESKNDTWDDSTGSTAPGGITSVTGADASVTVGGTATAPTLATGPFDELAGLHPPAGAWSNNGQKIQHVANGTAADDVATVGQLGGVALDSTGTDIQPLGTQSAGTSPDAARADHVHDWVLIPTGVKTANYTASPHDLVRVDTSGAARTITLPSAPADRTIISVKVVTSGNTCTINAAGADTFGTSSGPTSYLLRQANTVVFQYVAANHVWLAVTHSSPFPAASVAAKPANPTGTTSITAVMMGLGSSITFTPAGTGIVKITLTTLVQITAGSAGSVTVSGRYGTGSAPANAAAASGTTFGPATDPAVRVNTAAAGVGTPHTITDRLALTPSTPYWFDLAITSPGSGDTCLPGNIVAVIEELPA
jgi:hypothetical protein